MAESLGSPVPHAGVFWLSRRLGVGSAWFWDQPEAVDAGGKQRCPRGVG